MNIHIINIHHEQPPRVGYVYIGRSPYKPFEHFGNPFTHLSGHTLATVKVPTRADSVKCFDDWVRGIGWQGIEPMRRAWMLAHIDEIAASGDDVTLGCFCKPRNGFTNEHTCHGQVLRKLIMERRHE